MSKSRRKLGPLEQYDRFMLGSTSREFTRGPRGPLLVMGSIIGNAFLWLTGLITVARLSIIFTFVIITAISLAVLQRIYPADDLAMLLLASALIALILVTIGILVLKLVLRRDAQRLSQQPPTFGVFDEDARVRRQQNYRRKSGR